MRSDEKVSELEDRSTHRNDAERTETNKRDLRVVIGGIQTSRGIGRTHRGGLRFHWNKSLEGREGRLEW